MRIKILFFATLIDYVGAKTVEMEVPAGTTVATVKELLVKSYPKMASAQKSIMAAVNREYAAGDQIIPVDAEIAFFPPVSGGLLIYGLPNDHLCYRSGTRPGCFDCAGNAPIYRCRSNVFRDSAWDYRTW